MGFRSSIDLARLANALSRPGIDPRIWISYGTLLSEPFIETEEGQQDIFVDVLLWSPADPPPEGVVDNPLDVTLIVEPERNLRLTVKGGGNVILAVDTGKIYLGAEEETEPAAKGQSLKSYLESIKSTFDGHAHTSSEVGLPTSTPTNVYIPPVLPVPVTFPAPTDALLSTTTEVK